MQVLNAQMVHIATASIEVAHVRTMAEWRFGYNMKFGIRKPSIRRSIAARTSVRRMIRSKIRAPRGYGFITNPKKAAYNRIYNRTSVSFWKLFK